MGTARGRTRAIARIAGPLVMSMLLALPAPAAAESPGAAESALRATDEVRVAGAASTGTKVPDLGRGPADAVRPSGRAYAEGVVLVQYRVGARAKERAAARAAVHA